MEWEKCFSTRKHGEAEAFQLACEERYRRHGILRITDVGVLPEPPAVPYRK